MPGLSACGWALLRGPPRGFGMLWHPGCPAGALRLSVHGRGLLRAFPRTSTYGKPGEEWDHDQEADLDRCGRGGPHACAGVAGHGDASRGRRALWLGPAAAQHAHRRGRQEQRRPDLQGLRHLGGAEAPHGDDRGHQHRHAHDLHGRLAEDPGRLLRRQGPHHVQRGARRQGLQRRHPRHGRLRRDDPQRRHRGSRRQGHPRRQGQRSAAHRPGRRARQERPAQLETQLAAQGRQPRPQRDRQDEARRRRAPQHRAGHGAGEPRPPSPMAGTCSCATRAPPRPPRTAPT